MAQCMKLEFKLTHAGGNSQNVGIENDILRIESNLIDKNVVFTSTDFNLTISFGGLTHFIELVWDFIG